MKFLKNYQFILFFYIFTILISFILSIFNLIFPLSLKTNKIICLILISFYLLLSNIKEGKKLEKGAYKNGLKNSLIIIILLYLFGSIITRFSLSLERIIYYIILILCITLGNIIGINKKKN